MCHPLNGQTGCVVCRIFGSPWLPGLIHYRDLVANVTPVVDLRVAAPQSRRRGVRTGQYQQKREVLPGGSVLNGHLDHLIQEPALLALALAGLRSITAVGAGHSRGYGISTVEARALDALKRPVDEAELAAALRRLAPQGGQGRP